MIDDDSEAQHQPPTQSRLLVESCEAWINKYIRISKGNFVTSAQLAELSGLTLKRGMQCFHTAMVNVYGDRVQACRPAKRRGWKNIQVRCMFNSCRNF